MDYIYDVILNFNELYYEFYEWNSKDEIINIRKLPFFKVNDDTLISLKYNIVKLDSKSLNLIKDKYTLSDSIAKVEDVLCVFTNGKSALAVIFDSKGNLIKRSAMLFEEEEEVIDESKRLKATNFSFIINKKINNRNECRIHLDRKNTVINFINNTEDRMLLKYLYYDYFLREEEDVKIIKKELLKEINNDNNMDLSKLYNTIINYNI